jgi:predicted HD phosphohydrolase
VFAIGALILTALLHDVSHLLTLDETAAQQGVDHFHENRPRLGWPRISRRM